MFFCPLLSPVHRSPCIGFHTTREKAPRPLNLIWQAFLMLLCPLSKSRAMDRRGSHGLLAVSGEITKNFMRWRRHRYGDGA